MKKIMYTRLDDGGLSVVIPAPKTDIERILGIMSQEEYENHVWKKSVPEDAINPRYILDENVPSKEFRNAWCDVTPEPLIDIDLVKAKEIKLSQMREEIQKKFEELGFPVRLNPELEAAIISQETREKLQALRDATEPLKALVAEGYNDENILEQIRQLGKFN